MAENMEENVLNEFDDFDRIPCPTLDEVTLERESTSKSPNQKISACKRIIKRVEQMVNASLARLGIKSKVNLNETFSCGNEKFLRTQTSFSKTATRANDLNIKLNINVNKLRFPAFEFSSMVSAAVYRTVFANLTPDKVQRLQNNLRASGEQSTAEPELEDTVRHENKLAQYEVAKWFLREYLKDFLKQSFPEEFGKDSTSLDIVTELVSTELLGRMSEKEIQNLPQDLFSFNKYDEKLLRESKRFISSENLYEMRTEKLREKATQFAADAGADYSNAEALGSEQQFIALSETFAGKTDKVKAVLAGGFSNDNAQLRQFCQDYANSFMASNNLAPITINFVNEGNSQYIDKGQTQYININLSSKEIAGGNISELLMTLSHELTHAVDSSINKINGRYNERGGGLLNTMSENLNGCDVPEAKPLLKKVQSFCYQLNPNERHGRIGELSAVRFMKELYAGDPDMQAQMEESMKSYKAYQQTTINCARILPQKLAEFESELSALNIPASSKAYKMIRERIDYLKEIGKDLDVSAEQASIRDLIKIAENETGKTASAMVSAQQME